MNSKEQKAKYLRLLQNRMSIPPIEDEDQESGEILQHLIDNGKVEDRMGHYYLT